MVRIFFTYFLPLALPTVLYFIWMGWVRRKVDAAKARGEDVDHVELKTPWLRLLVAGVALMAVGLAVIAVVGGKSPVSSTYQAPQYIDGKIQPAQSVPK